MTAETATQACAAEANAAPCQPIARRTIYDGSIGLVEAFALGGEFLSGRSPEYAGYSPQYQVVLPYAGIVNFSAGGRVHHRIIDGNQTLFVTAGEEFAETLLGEDACRSLIITPSLEVLDELCGQLEPAQHPCFAATTRLANFPARAALHRVLGLAESDTQLQKDEVVLQAIQTSLDTRRLGAPAPSRVVDRARQMMHDHDCERMSLAQIAKIVGVAPVYLTQEFTRSLGIPMYKYQLRLRLNRALVQLPRCESITELALALGFSSHSHFTAAFRSVFGATPSALREVGALL